MSLASTTGKFAAWLTAVTLLIIIAYVMISPYLIRAPETGQVLIIFSVLYIITLAAFTAQLAAFKKFAEYTVHIILLMLGARLIVFLGLNFILIYFFRDTAIAGVILFFVVYLTHTILELAALMRHTNWLRTRA